jgi:hypothetical protein
LVAMNLYHIIWVYIIGCCSVPKTTMLDA